MSSTAKLCALGLVTVEQRLLFEVEEALERVKNKSYGRCEGCSSAIAAKPTSAPTTV